MNDRNCITLLQLPLPQLGGYRRVRARSACG